jgi:sn-glycerol 3-phosphate transport system substrate-binding protein
MTGHKKPEYSGVAKFLVHVSRPEVQAAWHRATGYLPTTQAAFELTRKQGFYDSHPGTEIPLSELRGDPGARAKVTRYAQASLIRTIVDEELEAAWARRKTPKEAVDSAVDRGNRLLRTASSPAPAR